MSRSRRVNPPPPTWHWYPSGWYATRTSVGVGDPGCSVLGSSCARLNCHGCAIAGCPAGVIDTIVSHLLGQKFSLFTLESPTYYNTIQKGVPQGAVLSPLIFNLRLIHLKRVFPSEIPITLYADNPHLRIIANTKQAAYVFHTLGCGFD